MNINDIFRLKDKNMKNKWAKFLKLSDKQYHIFASYCIDDFGIVRTLLEHFEGSRCIVNDPERDSLPGQLYLRNVIDQGIEKSKVTVLFITKHYLSDDLCAFMTNLAIWKYITSRGSHRVFPVILEPCRIPKCLKVLNCIHVWKYALKGKQKGITGMTYQYHVTERLKRALTEAQPKFRRIRWNGIKTLTWTKTLVEKVKNSAMKDRAFQQPCQWINPFQLWRLFKVLDHCYINCRYGHCTFACNGRNINMFLNHLNRCRYKPVLCPNVGCQIYEQKWTLEKHLEECPFTTVKCPSEGCNKQVLRRMLPDHLTKCKHYMFDCPNYAHGCTKRVTLIEVGAHKESCGFERLHCTKCDMLLLRRDMTDHDKTCVKSKINCSLCRKEILLGEQNGHILHDCLMAVVDCPNNGCKIRKKKYEILQHKLICPHRLTVCTYEVKGCNFKDKQLFLDSHVMQCRYRTTHCDICGREQIFKDLEDHTKECEKRKTCEFCGMNVPGSAWSTHERTCPRTNWMTHCDICRMLVHSHQLKDHKSQNCVEMSSQSSDAVTDGVLSTMMETKLKTVKECPTNENAVYEDLNRLNGLPNVNSSDAVDEGSVEVLLVLAMDSDTPDLPGDRKTTDYTGDPQSIKRSKGIPQSRHVFNSLMKTNVRFPISDFKHRQRSQEFKNFIPRDPL